MPRRYVNTRELAEICGTHVTTLENSALEAGIKPKKEGRTKLWPCPETVRAFFKGGANDRDRLLKAQADKGELEVAELRGELVRVEDIERDVETALKACQTRLLSIPTKTAAMVGAMSESEARDFIRDQIHEALREIVGLLEGLATAADSDGERMGGSDKETES